MPTITTLLNTLPLLVGYAEDTPKKEPLVAKKPLPNNQDRFILNPNPGECKHKTVTTTGKYEDGVEIKQEIEETHTNGKLTETCIINYRNGKMTDGTITDGKGKLVSQIKCDENGNLIEETTYINGVKKKFVDEKNKVTIYFDENGIPIIQESLENKKTIIKIYDLKGNEVKGLKPENIASVLSSKERFSKFKDYMQKGLIKHPYWLDSFEMLELGVSLDPKIKNLTDELEKRYSIKISFTPKEVKDNDHTPLDITEVESRLKALKAELLKYPPELFKGKNLTISLVSKIKREGEEETDSTQGLNGYHNQDRICLNKIDSFDHEVYHFLDWHVYKYYDNNTEWEQRYGKAYPGNKGFNWYHSIRSSKSISIPEGFPSHYSMVNINEHQAVFAREIFKNSISSGSINEDQKRQLVREYKLFSAGKMDEKYFDLIASGRTRLWNEADWKSYWDRKK